MPQPYPSKPLTHGNPAFLISLARLDSVRLAFSALNRSASTPSWPGVASATTERNTLLVNGSPHASSMTSSGVDLLTVRPPLRPPAAASVDSLIAVLPHEPAVRVEPGPRFGTVALRDPPGRLVDRGPVCFVKLL